MASPSARQKPYDCRMITDKEILVLYYSQYGATRQRAPFIARGIEQVVGARARVTTVPKVSTVCEAIEPDIPDDGAPYVETRDLEDCIGLALGSPTRSGSDEIFLEWHWRYMDKTHPRGKPAVLFTSSSNMHSPRKGWP